MDFKMDDAKKAIIESFMRKMPPLNLNWLRSFDQLLGVERDLNNKIDGVAPATEKPDRKGRADRLERWRRFMRFTWEGLARAQGELAVIRSHFAEQPDSSSLGSSCPCNQRDGLAGLLRLR
jgi:hypothetical protein